MTATGILNVEHVPTHRKAGAVRVLRDLIHRCTRLRAAVAYWTIDLDVLGPLLAARIGDPGGFLCVDIHHPTSIRKLANIQLAGGNVKLHLYDLAGSTEDQGIKGIPPFLLHSKELLFDMDDGTAALFIGSHNATKRALFGVNVESSLVVTMTQGCSLYQQAETYLEMIAQRCDLLDPDRIAYYEWLQGLDGSDNVLELETSSGLPSPGDLITLLGTERADHRNLKKVDQSIYVSVTPTHTDVETFFTSSIEETGHLGGTSTNFGRRIWAFRDGKKMPVLQPVGDIPDRYYKRASYYVTVKLIERLPESTRAFEPPDRKDKWEVDEQEMQGIEMPPRKYSGKRGDRPPRIRRASQKREVFAVMDLEQRRQIKERKDTKLVRRRVISMGGDEPPEI